LTKVILLAAGYGKRLKPITNNMPKCLVSINGKPLLEIWLNKLSKEGFGPFLINTHYKNNLVSEFVNQSKFKNQIELVYEKKLLGTAGTLLKNIDFFDSNDGLFLHADNYCEENLNKFLQAHYNRPTNCIMTMLTFKTSKPHQSGIVITNKKGVLKYFFEKISKPPGKIANGAIYLLSPQILKLIKKKFSSSKDFSNEIIQKFIGKIYCYNTKNFFLDIGDLKSYEQVNEFVSKKSNILTR